MDDEGKAQFIASTPTADSMGDTIQTDGWQLSEFKKNPVLLFAHDSRSLPVGKVSNIQVKNNQLIADVEFLPPGIDGFADKVRALVKGGFLSAVSVGFQSIEHEPRFNKAGDFIGLNFIKQKLRELSIVPVPANSQALAVVRGLGCSDVEERQFFAKSGNTKVDHSTNRNKLNIIKARARVNQSKV